MRPPTRLTGKLVGLLRQEAQQVSTGGVLEGCWTAFIIARSLQCLGRLLDPAQRALTGCAPVGLQQHRGGKTKEAEKVLEKWLSMLDLL
jgi:hypothetical protein